MSGRGAVFAVAVLLLGLAPAAAQGGRGLALVQQRCAMCHAIGKNDSSRLPAAPPLRKISDIHNLDQLADLLERGALMASHPQMPTFKFDRESAIAIVNYLRSIQD